MALPPGPAYLLRLLPYVMLPSVVVYSLLRLSEILSGTTFPIWLITTATIIAKPTLFILTRYYRNLRNIWDASSSDAVLSPYVHESAFSVISKLRTSFRSGYPGQAISQWSEECGNVFQIDLLTSSYIITLDPEHVKAILATKFKSFEKGSVARDIMGSLLGTGIFNSDGDMWKFHRSITRSFFTRERISDFEIYERNCDLSLKEVRNRLAEGYSIDVQDLISRFALDTVTEFLFGINVGSVSAAIPYPPSLAATNSISPCGHPSDSFVTAFKQCLLSTSERFSLGADWPLGAEFWSDHSSRMRKVMDEFTGPFLRKALAEREKNLLDDPKDQEQSATVLEHLLTQTQDPTILQDELTNLLFAGRDTTMCLLSFSVYMLAEHPHIERRLRQEIFEKVGQSGNPTSAQMHGMKYMRAFLNEVLRLYPPIPMNMRVSTEPVILSNSDLKQKPFYVPAGTQCLYPTIYMHRRTDLWGPDALRFDPDRFLDSRLDKYLAPNPGIFIPFSSGPRTCIGQQFAYNEATFYLVRLLQQFTGFKLDPKANLQPPEEWKACKGRKATEKVYVMSHLSMYIKGGLWVTMKGFKSGEF